MSDSSFQHKAQLQGVIDTIKMARENALLGQYHSAIVQYEIALGQLDGYMGKLEKTSKQYMNWKQARVQLQEEHQVTILLQQELSRFSGDLTSNKKEEDYVVNKAARRSDVYSSDDSSISSDPDVWAPLPSKPSFRGKPKQPSVVKAAPTAAKNVKVPQPQVPTKGKVQPGGKQPISAKINGAVSKGKDGAVEEKPKEELAPNGMPKYVPKSSADNELVTMLENDVVQHDCKVKWSDIAGQDEVKHLLQEAVILPQILPEFFTGIREPWKGILLFGPPGTGKTMLAKAVATECNTTFFNVSMATITSKWRGESEKLVRLLFEMARHYAPTTIFIDEIDSLCQSRDNPSEHEASRRVKTEILVQMDGIHTQEEAEKDKKEKEGENNDENPVDTSDPEEEGKEKEKPRSKTVLVLGATNHPWSIDDAMRRRLEKRIYIPLPDEKCRKQLFELFLINQPNISIGDDVDINNLVSITNNYSASDIKIVCRDASMMPMRRLIKNGAMGDVNALKMQMSDVNSIPISMSDLELAMKNVSSSVSPDQLKHYQEWMDEFGST
ncbi:katanin p60 ATPase-containing subunit A [Acrasis kona]|uniref:Katanin p60 ATPase-containing subunit A1 n=1 Tax=Acrasis kona TaxID=1008807 RepID=A0AAW2YWI7_9EUKA